MAIKIQRLDSSLEQVFLNHVNQDVFDYHFFLLDWKIYRDSIEIFLAIEEEKIIGMMLIYRKRDTQLRGRKDAINALIKHLTLEKAVIKLTRNMSP